MQRQVGNKRPDLPEAGSIDLSMISVMGLEVFRGAPLYLEWSLKRQGTCMCPESEVDGPMPRNRVAQKARSRARPRRKGPESAPTRML